MLTVAGDLARDGDDQPQMAVGDPGTLRAEVVGSRQVRLTGLRLGQTNLSIIAADGAAFQYEVVVQADLDVLRAELFRRFPDAAVDLAQLGGHVIAEGQARDTQQVVQIIETINAYLMALQGTVSAPGVVVSPAGPVTPAPIDAAPEAVLPPYARLADQATIAPPQVINLLRVPGPQQVLLKVQVAELNRTAMRNLGVSFLVQTDNGGFGQNVAGLLPFGSSSGTGGATGGMGGMGGGGSAGGGTMTMDPLSTTNLLTAGTPLYGVIGDGDFSFYIDALRRNDVFRILAEPNLVALQGEEASFLAGGEFPVPVPQVSNSSPVITVQYREFGVGLSFVPFIIDGDRIRLSVAPEVSSLDFTQGIELSGFRVPALNKRRTSTVVELRHGQTLAISGLLQLEMNGTTARIPGLGDLPYIGAFFRNNTMRRTEKELVVLVTPYLIEPMEPGEVPPRPGDEIAEPGDKEFYMLGHIESISGDGSFRSTAAWADPLGVEQRLKLHDSYLRGPQGYSRW